MTSEERVVAGSGPLPSLGTDSVLGLSHCLWKKDMNEAYGELATLQMPNIETLPCMNEWI